MQREKFPEIIQEKQKDYGRINIKFLKLYFRLSIKLNFFPLRFLSILRGRKSTKKVSNERGGGEISDEKFIFKKEMSTGRCSGVMSTGDERFALALKLLKSSRNSTLLAIIALGEVGS